MFLLQLKNMVNALLSSKHSGTKAFELSVIHFGWKEIQVSIQVLFVRFVLCCTILLEYVCKRMLQSKTRLGENGTETLGDMFFVIPGLSLMQLQPRLCRYMYIPVKMMYRYQWYSSAFITLFQQEEVLTEIFSHISTISPPVDCDSARYTLKYLESCSLIFEKGLLSHERIKSTDSKVFENIQLRFKFFCDWFDSILERGKIQQDSIFCMIIM